MAAAEQNEQEALDRASAFFERAEKVAESDNFDYAIELFLDGLCCAPDEVEKGHKALRHAALIRQGKGGRKPSISERLKKGRAKTPLDQMLNTEYLLAKDPDNLQYAQTLMKAAAAAGYKKTTEWIADLIFQAEAGGGNPKAQTFLDLKEAYSAVGLFEKALAACQYASRLKPEDGQLKDELRDLSAQFAVQKGKYGEGQDFRGSIKNRQEQEKLQAQDRVIKTRDVRLSAVEDARKDYEQDSELPTNIFRLADALADLGEDASENEAIELLEDKYHQTADFSYQRHAGQIKLKQLRRKIRQVRQQLQANPDDAAANQNLEQLQAKLNEEELVHWRDWVANYPTDLRAKFEYAMALMRNKRYDDAIPLFQEARKSPRHSVLAMDKMGLCFLIKGWLDDAIDIFTQAMKMHELADDALGKELRYNLGRTYEELGRTGEAIDLYRKIAQLDFNYKDVRQRVDRLRKQAPPESGP